MVMVPVLSATGLMLTPSTRFSDAADFNVLFVPDGGGVNAVLNDEEVLAFIRDKPSKARFVTSVCTGSLRLGKAGFLSGRRATTHWNALDLLPRFGAIPAQSRDVRDGSFITADSITSRHRFSG